MQKQKIHILGIGGIGISALAQLYVHQGHMVSGTNNSVSPETLDRLRTLGVPISLDIAVEALPSGVDMFVYSDAWLSLEPAFMEEVRALGIPMLSYFEALGEATREGTSIVVAGTHGKTTTTAMLAKILIDAGKEPTVIVGSVLSEQGSNFVAGRPDLFVIEGCEYRRHFLHLHPRVLVINNVELDHTDYYTGIADIQQAFHTLIARVPEDGCVVTDTDSRTIVPILADAKVSVKSYQTVKIPTLRARGAFNQSNARAAKAAARAFDEMLDETSVNASLADFRGTWRRFEYKGTTVKGAVVYDDYAHHPTAIQSTLEMIRQEFPDKHILVVFHPHLFSRTRDLMESFARALAHADEVVLAPIYAAREEPVAGVTSEVLADKINAFSTAACAFDSFGAIVSYLTSQSHIPHSTTLIVTMGAGDIYKVAEVLTGDGGL